MQIYVFRDNQQFGPYSTDELRAFYANGQVQLAEPCRIEQDGATEWTTVGNLLGIAKPPPSPPRGQTSGPDQRFYDRVAAELQAKQLHEGLWARAIAETGGDMDQARALYIHLRAAALQAAGIKRSRANIAYAAAGIAAVVVAVLFAVFHSRSSDERTAKNSVDASPIAPSATPQVLPKSTPSAERVKLATPKPVPQLSADPDYIAAAAAEREKQWEDAIQLFQRALDRFPRSAEIYRRLGAIYTTLERYANSASAYERSLELEPDSDLAASNLAVAYRLNGQHEKSIAAYEKVLAKNPLDDAAWFFTGTSHMALGNNAEAEDSLLRSAAITPDWPATWYYLGLVCARQNASDRALLAYATSLQLDPKHKGAWKNFTELYSKRGPHWPQIQAWLQAPDEQLVAYRREALKAARQAAIDLFPQLADERDQMWGEMKPVYEGLKEQDEGNPSNILIAALRVAMEQRIPPKSAAATNDARGQLTIENGTASDAIVKVVSATGNVLIARTVVTARGTETIRSIPDGYCLVLYALGDRYEASTSRLTGDVHAARFEKSVGFATSRELRGDQIITSSTRYSLTLHPVIGGNAKTKPIPLKEFDAY